MTLQIDFPGPNEQDVIVIRCMVIAPVGGGKTTLMRAMAPEFAPPDRWVVVGPVRTLADTLGCEYHQLFGRDHEACSHFFGELIRSNRSVELLVDEFDEFCPGGSTGASGGYSCEELWRILNYARNKDPGKVHGNEIAVFVSGRGTADVTTNSIRCMDIVFFGNMWEGNAVKYLRASVKQGSIDFEKIVRHLPPFVFMVWAPNRGGFKGFIEVHEDGTWNEWNPPESMLKDAEADSSENEDDEPSPHPPESSSTPTPGSTATGAG